MAPTSDNHTSDQEAGAALESSAFKSTEELISLAQDYFSKDFPNPERTGCPSPDALRATVSSDRLPDDKLRAHLFGCSECFREYQNALAAYRKEREEQPAQPLSWWGEMLRALMSKPVPVSASVISLLVLVGVGAYFWRQHGQSPGRTIAQQQAEPVRTPLADSATGGLVSATPEISPAPVMPAEQPSRTGPPAPANRQPISIQRPPEPRQSELIAMNTVRVHLEESAALRDVVEAGGEREKVINLSQSRTRLLLTLPSGSVKDTYDVSIVDASGKPLVTAKARSADGKTLTAILNLQALAPGRYRLRLAREAEAPDYYPIVVGGVKTAPQKRGP